MGTWAGRWRSVYYIDVAAPLIVFMNLRPLARTSLNVVNGGSFEYLVIAGGGGADMLVEAVAAAAIALAC